MAMPKSLCRSTLVGIQDAKLRERVKKLVWQTPKLFVHGANLLISGDPGAGKSSIASLFARSFRAHNIPSFWTTTWKMREHNRDRDRFGRDGDLSMMARVRTVEVLVIDDLRSDPMDGWFSQVDLTNLIRVRSGDMLPTIVTTSLSGGALYESPSISALRGRMLHIEVYGSDLRYDSEADFGRRFE
jgi:DNA replication protein DnaC